MKKVLRYSLDEFLEYIDSRGYVRDNTTDRYVDCNIVLKMDDGGYKVLLENYMCDALYLDGEVVAFRDNDIYLEPCPIDIEKRCMRYNDNLYLLDSPSGFIDEIYILCQSEPLDEVKYSERLNKIAQKINSENLSTMEKVELLIENYDQENKPFFRL